MALDIQRGYGREGTITPLLMVGGSKLSTFENNMQAEVYTTSYNVYAYCSTTQAV